MVEKLLARFGFSFLIIGSVLVYGSYHEVDHFKATLEMLGAVLCVLLGVVGIRLRHRRPR